MKKKFKAWLQMDWRNEKPFEHGELGGSAATIFLDKKWMDEEGYNGLPVLITITPEGLKTLKAERAANQEEDEQNEGCDDCRRPFVACKCE